MNIASTSRRRDLLERILAGLSAAACLAITIWVWLAVSQQQAIWPLPALDLIEVVVLAGLGAWGIFRADAGGSLLAWAGSGALLGFAVISGASIGLFYLPVAGAMVIAALWHDRTNWGQLGLHVVVAFVAAWAQAALMLALVRMLAPNALS